MLTHEMRLLLRPLRLMHSKLEMSESGPCNRAAYSWKGNLRMCDGQCHREVQED